MAGDLTLKSLKNAANQYNLVAEDEIEIKINGTMILKEQVPDGKKWEIRLSLYIEEQDI